MPTFTMADTWQQICPAQIFCFSHPADWKVQQVRMLDSTAGIIEGENIRLSYDYGMYSDNFSALSDAQRQPIVIDGLDAELITGHDFIALYVAKVEHIEVMNADMALSMSVKFCGQKDKDLALQLFRSIRFKQQTAP